jgi:hypothetical protein
MLTRAPEQLPLKVTAELVDVPGVDGPASRHRRGVANRPQSFEHPAVSTPSVPERLRDATVLIA